MGVQVPASAELQNCGKAVGIQLENVQEGNNARVLQ